MSFRSNSNHIQLLLLELAKQTTNRDLARLNLTKDNHHITRFRKKLQHLQILIDRVAQEEQEARIQIKVDIDKCTALNELVKSIEQKIRIAKEQQKLYNTIMLQQLYNSFATVLDECLLHKNKILAKMKEEQVHDPKSMDSFICLLFVEGYLMDVPAATGGSATTEVHEHEGETKEASVHVGVGTAPDFDSVAPAATPAAPGEIS